MILCTQIIVGSYPSTEDGYVERTVKLYTYVHQKQGMSNTSLGKPECTCILAFLGTPKTGYVSNLPTTGNACPR